MYDGHIVTMFFQYWCNIMIKLCWFSSREYFDVNSATLNLFVDFFNGHTSRYTVWKQCNIGFFRNYSILIGVHNRLKGSGCYNVSRIKIWLWRHVFWFTPLMLLALGWVFAFPLTNIFPLNSAWCNFKSSSLTCRGTLHK